MVKLNEVLNQIPELQTWHLFIEQTNSKTFIISSCELIENCSSSGAIDSHSKCPLFGPVTSLCSLKGRKVVEEVNNIAINLCLSHTEY